MLMLTVLRSGKRLLICLTASSRASTANSALCKKTSPYWFRAIRFPTRLKSGTPTSSSNFEMELLSVGWETWRMFADFVIFCSFAIVINLLSWEISIFAVTPFCCVAGLRRARNRCQKHTNKRLLVGKKDDTLKRPLCRADKKSKFILYKTTPILKTPIS